MEAMKLNRDYPPLDAAEGVADVRTLNEIRQRLSSYEGQREHCRAGESNPTEATEAELAQAQRLADEIRSTVRVLDERRLAMLLKALEA
jgi:hypothetical protein